MTTTARKVHEQVKHHISMNIAWNTAGIAAGVEFPNRLPAGSVIDKVTVLATTPFNAATTNTISVGFTGTGTELINATSVTAATRVDTVAPIANAGPRANDTQLFASYAQTGAAATAGAATILVYYIPQVG